MRIESKKRWRMTAAEDACGGPERDHVEAFKARLFIALLPPASASDPSPAADNDPQLAQQPIVLRNIADIPERGSKPHLPLASRDSTFPSLVFPTIHLLQNPILCICINCSLTTLSTSNFL